MSGVDQLVALVWTIAHVKAIEIAAKYGFKEVSGMLKEHFDQGPKAVGAAMGEGWEDYSIRYGQQIEHLMVRMFDAEVDRDELRVRVEELAANGTTKRLLATFAFEAMRETLPERREMLAAAAAMLTLSDWPIEEKARAERSLRLLDPRHVMQLYGLSHVCTRWLHGAEQNSIDHVRQAVWRSLPDGEVLETSGCVRVTSTATGGAGGVRPNDSILELTATGRLVLRTLADYVRDRDYPMIVPGREAPKDARTKADALAFFDSQIPGLRGRLALLARRSRLKDPYGAVRYDYPGWGRRFQTPALPNALEPGYLFFDHVDEEDAKGVEAQKPFHSIDHERMRNQRELREIAAKADALEPGRWTLKIHGPHDVLMHLAQDVDAVWNQLHHEQY